MTVNEQWKELRPKIGSFISSLDGLYKGAENLDEAIGKAEARGYQKGYNADKTNVCSSCYKEAFFYNCNGYIDTIEKFMKLSQASKLSIKAMILHLYYLEQLKENKCQEGEQ